MGGGVEIEPFVIFLGPISELNNLTENRPKKLTEKTKKLIKPFFALLMVDGYDDDADDDGH